MTVEREVTLQVERVPPEALWHGVRTHVGLRNTTPGNQHWRIVHVLMLLLGDSGLRREEAAGASRERTVPVSLEAVEAIRAHWRDRDEEFDDPAAVAPLLSPLVVPNTQTARREHEGDHRMPVYTNALNRLIDWLRRRLVELETLTPAAHAALALMSPHAFRHTFGTIVAANDVPIDVGHKVLGHLSVQTPSIYVQTEQQRVMREIGQMSVKRTTSEYAVVRQAGEGHIG